MRTELSVDFTLDCRAIKGDFFGLACFLADGRVAIFDSERSSAVDTCYSWEEANSKYLFFNHNEIDEEPEECTEVTL